MYKKLIYLLQGQLRFNSQEARGFVVIMIIVLVCLFAPMAMKSLWKQPALDFSEDMVIQDSLNRLLAEHLKKNPIRDRPKKWASDGKTLTLTPTFFDPNTASKSQLENLGLSKYIVKNILAFRVKGGKFKTKKDFAKIYGLEPAAFNQLSPYLQLPDTLTKTYPKDRFPTYAVKRPTIVQSFDINTADTSQLISLKGIGSKLAARIVKYRDALGGIINTDQFNEIYGLDTLALAQLRQYAFIKNGFEPKKLDIHQALLTDFQNHPYLSKRESSILFNYMLQHPNISKNDILEMKGVSKGKLEKLMPYLK